MDCTSSNDRVMIVIEKWGHFRTEKSYETKQGPTWLMAIQENRDIEFYVCLFCKESYRSFSVAQDVFSPTLGEMTTGYKLVQASRSFSTTTDFLSLSTGICLDSLSIKYNFKGG